jgi:S-formylglutathione hydrolase FrmB
VREQRLSRRALIVRGGAAAAGLIGAVALADAFVVPGLGVADAEGVECGAVGPLPDVVPGPIERGTFRSAARGREVGFALVYPPGARPGDRLPLCLYLHGRGGSHRNVADPPMGLPWFLADRVAAGVPPLALLAVDGGNAWWHLRANGDDPQRMLLDEVLPLAERRGLATERLGLIGTSMGGYGALLLAERLGPERVAAVGALSPALYRRYADALEGAFDSPADFAAHDVFAQRERLRGIAVRIDCGDGDRYGFADTARAFLAVAPPGVVGSTAPGCHDTAYWRTVAPVHVEHVARALGA